MKKEYLEAKSKNIHISNESMFSLLNLVAGLGEQGSCSGAPRGRLYLYLYEFHVFFHKYFDIL